MYDATSPLIMPEPNSGCWLWVGIVNQHGYGRIHIEGLYKVAHRVVYEANKGITVPLHLDLDHLCRVRCCVNPDHLEPVSRSENISRALRFGRVTDRSKCRHGHPLTPDNIYHHPSGFKVCQVCKKAAKLRSTLKAKASS